MSKYDKFFNNTTNNRSVFKSNIFVPKIKDDTYSYKDNEFPDLVISKKSTSNVVSTNDNDSKNYSNITSTNIPNEVKKIIENPVPPGWVQYSKPKGSNKSIFIVTYGDKTKRQLQQEEKYNMFNNPFYIHDQIISTLDNNWNRYKIQYDAIHGEGAYDSVYYTEPIYGEDDNLSETASDIDNDNDYYYSSEEEYNFNNRKKF
jgi:hypothetical protein